MFKLNNSSQNTHNTSNDLLLTSMTPIKVMLVDYNQESLEYVVELLRSCSFEVTCVDHSGVALSLLTDNNSQYDLFLLDNKMSNVDIHTFLRLTKDLDPLPIVISEQDDDALIHEVFKSGAFLVIKRPLTYDAVRRIRQDVIRQRMRKNEICKNKIVVTKKATQDIKIHKKSYSIRKKGRYDPMMINHRSSDDDDNDDDDYDSMKKKICVEWTKVLHQIFLNAYYQLEEGRRFPKKILELMGVPGLTRMQVASHLQVYEKSRKEKRSLNENKTIHDHPLPSNPFPHELNGNNFGCMGSLQTNNEQSNTLVGIDMPINEWQQQSHMENQSYICSPMMNISSENNTPQQVQYTQIPLGSDLDMNQGDTFGRGVTEIYGYIQQPILDLGQGSSSHDFSCFPRQEYEEFPDILKDLDNHVMPNKEGSYDHDLSSILTQSYEGFPNLPNNLSNCVMSIKGSSYDCDLSSISRQAFERFSNFPKDLDNHVALNKEGPYDHDSSSIPRQACEGFLNFAKELDNLVMPNKDTYRGKKHI